MSSVRQSNRITQPFTPSSQSRVAPHSGGHQTWLRPHRARLQAAARTDHRSMSAPRSSHRCCTLRSVACSWTPSRRSSLARPRCYVPPRGEPEQIAQILASRHGLLIAERTGYVDAYRPTLLGTAVIWQCLLHDLQARPGGDAYVQ